MYIYWSEVATGIDFEFSLFIECSSSSFISKKSTNETSKRLDGATEVIVDKW